MKLENIKPWQWFTAAALIGTALAWLHTSGGTMGDGAWRPGVSQIQFESLLRMTRLPNAPAVFRSLRVYPSTEGRTYVSGDYLIDLSDARRYRKFEFFAQEPFRANGVEFRDVRDFLKQKYPGVSYSYAWWQSVAFQRGLWFAIPLLVIGGVCPAALRVLKQASAASTSQAEAVQPAAPLAPFALPEAGDSVEAAVETPVATEAPAIAVLSSDPLQPAALAVVEEEKDYKGEYYPVARPAPHERRQSADS